MSDSDFRYVPFNPFEEPGVKPDPETEWSDYGKAVESGVAGVRRSIAGAQQYVMEKVASSPAAVKDSIQNQERELYGLEQQVLQGQMSEGARRIKSASLMPGEGQESAFNNLGRWLALNGAEALPSTVASIIPAVMVGPLLGSTAGFLAAGGAGGAINGGDLYNDIADSIEKKSDDFLKENSPAYAGYRTMMDEQSARAMLRSDMAGFKPVLAAAFTMLTSKYGVEGLLAKKAAGEGIGGRLKAAGVGMLGEGSQEFGETGFNEILSGAAQKEQNIGDIDWMDVLRKSVDAAAIGAGIGGVTGLVTGGHSDTHEQPPKGTGTGNRPAPNTDADIGNDVNPPSGSQTKYDKAEQIKAKSRARSGVEVVDGIDSTTRSGLVPTDLAGKARGIDEEAQARMDATAAAQKRRASAEMQQKMRGLMPEAEAINTPFGEQSGPVNEQDYWDAYNEAKSPASDYIYDYESPENQGEYQDRFDDQSNMPPRPSNQEVEDELASYRAERYGQEPEFAYGAEFRQGDEEPVTTPEPQNRFDAQLTELKQGKRAAVFYPGQFELTDPVPEGMKVTRIKAESVREDARGIYVYDPAKTNPKDIRARIKKGTDGELMGFGPSTKQDAINSGNPAALQRVNSEGVATAEMAVPGDQIAENAAAMARPGDTIEVTSPQETLKARQEGKPKAEGTPVPTKAEAAKQVSKGRSNLPAPAPEADLFSAPVSEQKVNQTPAAPKKQELGGFYINRAERQTQEARDAADKPVGEGHLTKAQKAERKRQESAAKRAFAENAPGENEMFVEPADLLRGSQERKVPMIRTMGQATALKARLERIVKAVGALPKYATKGMSNELVFAIHARDAVTHYVGKTGDANRRKMNDFVADEIAARKGDFEPLRKRRLEEGDQASRPGQKDVETVGGSQIADTSITMAPDELTEAAQRNWLYERAMQEIEKQKANGKIDLESPVLQDIAEQLGTKIADIEAVKNALLEKEPKAPKKKAPAKKAEQKAEKPATKKVELTAEQKAAALKALETAKRRDAEKAESRKSIGISEQEAEPTKSTAKTAAEWLAENDPEFKKTKDKGYVVGNQIEESASASNLVKDKAKLAELQARALAFAKRGVGKKGLSELTDQIEALQEKIKRAEKPRVAKKGNGPVAMEVSDKVMEGDDVVFDRWEDRKSGLEASEGSSGSDHIFNGLSSVFDQLDNWPGIRSENMNAVHGILEQALVHSFDQADSLINAYAAASYKFGDERVKTMLADIAKDADTKPLVEQLLERVQNAKPQGETESELRREILRLATDVLRGKESPLAISSENIDAAKNMEAINAAFGDVNKAFVDYTYRLRHRLLAKPLVLPEYKTGKRAVFDGFHGTPKFFDRFKREVLGGNTGAPSAREAFFFSRNPATANTYSYVPHEMPNTIPGDDRALRAIAEVLHEDTGLYDDVGGGELEYNRMRGDIVTRFRTLPPGKENQVRSLMEHFGNLQSEPKTDANIVLGEMILNDVRDILNSVADETPNTIMSRIKLDNPLVYDFNGEHYREESYYDIIKRAKKEGRDGVIMLNTFDGGPQDVIYAVFNEDQISQRFNPERGEGQIFPREAANDVRIEGTKEKAIETTTLGEAFERTSPSKFGFTRLRWKMFKFFRGRLLDLADDVKVHIVDDNSPLLRPNGRVVAGYYHPTHDHIVVGASYMADGKQASELLIHEGAHAAFYHALSANPRLRFFAEGVWANAVRVAMDRGEITDHTKASGKLYGLRNLDEFIAEGWANDEFRKWLRGIGVENDLADMWQQTFAPRTMGIRTLYDGFINTIREAFGLAPSERTMLEAMLDISRALDEHVVLNGRQLEAVRTDDIQPLDAARLKQGTSEVTTNLGGKIRRGAMKLESMGMLARRLSTGLFSGTDAPMRAYKFRRRMDTMRGDIIEQTGGDQLIREHAEMQRANPEAYEKMVDLGYEFSFLDASPGGEAANPHFGKNKKRYWQARGRVNELTREFNTLPKDYQDLLNRTSDTFKKIQNDASLEEIKNVLNTIGINEAGLAERIHDQGLTDADREKFKTRPVVEALERAREFKKISGLYLPAMRRGDHVVFGRYDIDKPANASFLKDVEGNKLDDTIYFDGNGNYAQAQREAQEYLADRKNPDAVNVREALVDANGQEVRKGDKDDTSSRKVIAVRLQNQFTEFTDTESEAMALAERMREAGLKGVYAEPREDTLYKTKNVFAPDMDRIARTMKKDEKFRQLDEEGQKALLQALAETGIRFAGDNSLGHRRLFRRKVQGFSKDLARNVSDYLNQAAGYLARLRNQPEVDRAIREMRDYMESNRYESADQAFRRREQYEEFIRRAYAPNDGGSDTTRSPVIKRLVQISMINKLGGISWHLVNAHEPWLVGLPYITGRHRIGDATNAMRRSYSMLGAGSGVMQGIMDTAKSLRQTEGFTNFHDFFVKQMQQNGVSDELVKNFDDVLTHLHQFGLFDRESGMDAMRLDDPTSNILGRGLDRFELTLRQLGTTMEAINRAVVALTAYQLELKRTGSHEAAKSYAFDTIHDTMGDYSATNASPIFKGNFGALALQFKKYGQKQYWLYGMAVRNMMNGDKEAMHQFAGYLATHAAVAGLLGLPGLELIKFAFMGAGLMGLGFSYDDFEDWVRGATANLLGAVGGEVVSKGLYRFANIDMAGRLGQDSLLTFGEPRSYKQQDIKTWLFDTIAGAPIGTVMNQIDAVQKFVGGEFMEGLQKSAVPKFAVDITRAVRGATEGKESTSGRQTLTPYTPYEAGLRSIGLTPAREAEQGRFRARAQEQSKQVDDKRRKFVQDWVKAKPDDRAKMWGTIERWNRDQSEAQRLTRKDLQAAVKRRESEKDKTVNTVVTNRRNEDLVKGLSQVYNLRQ